MMRFVGPAALVLAMACVPMASGAVLYSDNFESDAVGGAATGWTSPNADTVLTVQDDGTGNHVLDVNETPVGAGAGRALVVPITSVTLADGDSVQFSFDVKVQTAVASIPVGDRQFRFALFNSEGTTTTTDDLGYVGRVDSGAASGSSLDLSGAFAGTSGIFGVSGSASHKASTNTAATLNDNLVHTITISLQRSGDNVIGSATFTNGTTISSGTMTDTFASTEKTYTFDELAIGYNSGATLDYTLDNVSVVSTPGAAPEPASLGLLGVAGIGLLVRRRKA